jgi:hypothetical protein
MNTKTTKLLFVTLITTISMVATPVHAKTPPPHAKYHGILPDAYYDALSVCETGGNWQHSTKSYTGGLGIHRQTFRRWSNYNSAKGKTAAQQVKVADAIAFRGHTQRNGEHIWRVGPWGWGCLKGQKHLQKYICQSNHKLVRKWKRHC